MKKSLVICCVLFLLTSILGCSSDSDFTGKKDVILVLDTSMSMIGHGGSNIMPGVKDSISTYVDELEAGDRVSFVTFDSDVVNYPSIIISDDKDKEIIKKYISATPVKGKWTQTYSMLNSVFNKAEELQEESPERQLVIVVMTDGIDDPSPGASQSKFNIKDIASNHEGKDWWIFLVNFNDMKQALNEKQAKQREELKEGLAQVSDKSYIIDSDNKPEEAIGQVIEQEKKSRNVFPYLLAILLLILLLGLLIAFLARRQAQLKAKGSLEYWNNDLIRPVVEKFNITKYMQKEIRIGNALGCTLRLRELELKSPFTIEAVRAQDKTIQAKVVAGQGTQIEFDNPNHGEYLEHGETFRAGNYGFRYLSDNPTASKTSAGDK